MEEYSIFGSNISNDLLLYLKNNQNNITIDIHNNNHNFSLNYISSNQTVINYITKQLQDIKTLDDNNYIHSSINNSNSVEILGSYVEQNVENTINGINFTNLENATILDLSHRNDKTVASEFIFDHYDNSIYDYYKYSSTTQYTIEDTAPLGNLKFYDLNQQEIYTLSGLLIYAKFNLANTISTYKFLTREDKVFPHKIKLFAISGKYVYQIDEKTFNSYAESTQSNKVSSSLNTNEIIINVESVLINKYFFETNAATFNRNIANTNFNQVDGMKIKNRNNIFNPTSYILQLIYNGIKLLATNTKVINHYDIDMSDNNIQNVKSLATNQLILNNVIYDDIISSDNVSEKITNILDGNMKMKFNIVNDVLSDRAIQMNNLEQLFSSVYVSEALTAHKTINNFSNHLIPYVIYNNTLDDIEFIYDCNVSTKHILNLKSLDSSITDEILKHCNGIIYKSNTLDNLKIDKDLSINNNIIVDGHITINSNTLKWDPNIFKFTHNDGVTFQTAIFTYATIFPDVYNTKNHNFAINANDYSFKFILHGIDHEICHPFNIISDSDNIPIIYNDYIGQANGNIANGNLMLLNLIQKYNIYISSRFGNSFNNSQSVILFYYNITNFNELTSDTFSDQLYYMDSGQSNFYLDYYEFRLSDKVLLHQLQLHDIEFSEFKMKLNSIHAQNHLYDVDQYYNYTDKNYIKYFDIIGYDSDWELIQKVDVTDKIKNPNRLIIVNINAKKSYSKYRITFDYQNIHGEYADNSLPYIFTDLTLKYESLHNNNAVDFKGKNITFDVANTLSINNYVALTSNTITKLIINEDYKNVEHYLEASKNPYAVCHINHETDNTKLLNNNLLKLGLINKDSKLPDISTTFNSTKEIYNVYHSLHIVDNDLFYTQSVNNNLNINIPESDQKYLTITSSGVVAINTDKPTLSNIIKTFTGLVINGDLRFNLSNLDGDLSLPYIDIGINNNLDILNSYKINLPDNCGYIDQRLNYFLQPYNIDNENKTISTKWGLASTIFQTGNIYIGSKENNNLFDIHDNFCNIHPGSGTDTSEHTTHIRKLVIGYPEDLEYDRINKHVLTIGGSVYATHDISTDSDAAYKYDLQKIDNCKDKVNTLTGYTFLRNDTTEKRRFCGLIAQDVEKVLPEAIIKKHDSKLRVLYNNLSGLFVECFKDLYSEIDTLRDEIKDLKKEVYSHKEKL